FTDRIVSIKPRLPAAEEVGHLVEGALGRVGRRAEAGGERARGAPNLILGAAVERLGAVPRGLAGVDEGVLGLGRARGDVAPAELAVAVDVGGVVERVAGGVHAARRQVLDLARAGDQVGEADLAVAVAIGGPRHLVLDAAKQALAGAPGALAGVED